MKNSFISVDIEILSYKKKKKNYTTLYNKESNMDYNIIFNNLFLGNLLNCKLQIWIDFIEQILRDINILNLNSTTYF